MDTRAAKLALARKKLKDHQVKKGVLKEGNGNEYREDDAQNTKDSHICENPIVTDASIRPDDDNIVKQTINLTDQNQNYNNCQPLSPEVNVTELLVSSKRNLELTVNQLQLKLSQAESDYSAALNSHNLSKKQLSSLEKNLKNINDKYMIMAEEVQSKDRVIENLHAQKSSLLDENSNLQDQLEFTKTVLTAKETENDSLHSQLYKLQEQLDATQLHLQQITNGSADCITPSNGTQDGHLTVALQQKILALEQQIKVLQKERDQISSHYEHYVGDLNNQLKSALVKNEELVREVQDLTNREMGLIEQISDMEIRLQNYQKFKESVDSKALANDNINELQHSHAQTMDMLKELSNKYEKLQKEFTDSEAKVRELSQSQDKLELVEKITAEKYLNRELTIKLAEIEEKAKDMNIKLKAKDEEMIRLQTNSREIEKQLELLSKESTFVEGDEQPTNQENNTELLCIHTHEHNINDKHENHVEIETKEADFNSGEVSSDISNDSNIPKEHAMVKLQERFLKIMEEVADLSDEKHRLEHIILQLQNETDTICEYVALYQQQRSLLKKRDEDRSAQIKIFQAECDRLRKQLEELGAILIRFAEDPKLLSYFKDDAKQADMTKVMDLLTNLKRNALIDPKKINLDLNIFYPCSCCSGQLIDV
ncbi:hypothetical protein MSG28_002193 [Choristoneura fumiferana]|uniref:Uncharacterized protein n=1 Tax=Choristoneura fumiferana TaxID=7141 RepID=A0ACC0JUQ6_CHOFU|nr:hypothetical protein MSG28_002193 [Choristoneura fumiferana]